MFTYIRIILFFISYLIFAMGAQASHLVGGELFYNCLGPDTSVTGNFQIQINMNVYRDCHSFGAPFDNPVHLVRYDHQNIAVDTLYMYVDSVRNIPFYFESPCLTAPPNVCVETGFYTDTISIPGGVGDFTLSWQRCCRNSTIVNIVNPGGAGNTNTTLIKDPLLFQCNSSPRFTNFPPLVICENHSINFDHSATDPDNDSLIFKLCTPLNGGSTTDPGPFALPPPYNEITWKPGITATSPIPANPAFSLSSTGIIDGSPTALGQYVVGVCVSEYRNGVLLSTTFRDFQFNVVNCEPELNASIQKQMRFCEGLSYQMQNLSIGGTYYKWDFGVDGIEGDTSNLFSPSFTFPDTGSYQIRLIINPGWPCADTSYESFDIRSKLSADFEVPTAQCFEGNRFALQADGNFGAGATFKWDFPNSTISSSMVQDPIVSFQQPGVHTVILTISQDGCERFYKDSLEVIPNPVSLFSFDKDSSCVPFDVSFISQTRHADNPVFTWDFGDGNKAHGRSAIHTYSQPGIFDVSLLVENSGKCKDTSVKVMRKLITAIALPVAGFKVDKKEMSKFDALVKFEDISTNSHTTEYFPLPGVKLTNPENEFLFPDTGHFNIMQISYNEFACADTFFLDIFVYDEFHIYIPNAFTPNGDGLNDLFMPIVSGVSKYSFQVFNRWGELVYETTDTWEGWNGNRHEVPSQNGSYVYKVQTVDLLGKPYEHKGSFMLIK